MPVPRKFDWEEAQRLRAEGWAYRAIANALGVTDTAIQRACDPGLREKMKERQREWQQSGVCIDCGGQRSRNTTHERTGRGQKRCKPCADIAAATSVRENELRCGACREWKPDDDFPLNRREPQRRDRHDLCRPCQTEAKRRWRERHPDRYEAGEARNNERRRAARAAS